MLTDLDYAALINVTVAKRTISVGVSVQLITHCPQISSCNEMYLDSFLLDLFVLISEFPEAQLFVSLLYPVVMAATRPRGFKEKSEFSLYLRKLSKLK